MLAHLALRTSKTSFEAVKATSGRAISWSSRAPRHNVRDEIQPGRHGWPTRQASIPLGPRIFSTFLHTYRQRGRSTYPPFHEERDRALAAYPHLKDAGTRKEVINMHDHALQFYRRKAMLLGHGEDSIVIPNADIPAYVTMLRENQAALALESQYQTQEHYEARKKTSDEYEAAWEVISSRDGKPKNDDNAAWAGIAVMSLGMLAFTESKS